MKKQKKIPLWKGFKLFLLSFFLYLFLASLPIFHAITPFLTGTHLVLFTNEFEARPCGGFLTAFGTFSLLPFHYEIKNAYHFEKNDFGPAPEPLNMVSPTLKFWDLGTSSDLSICSQSFKSAYEETSQQEIDQVVLFNIGSLEKLFAFFGSVTVDDKIVNSKSFFSFLTQSAANIDRHDEKALSTRKKIATKTGKKMIKALLIRPWLFPKISFFLNNQIKNGAIYIEGVSPQIKPEKTDFSMIEWNLGGGKSSRFLKKKIKILAREVLPEQWEIEASFSVLHLGGENEPLSQTWNGLFELRFPNIWKAEPIFIKTKMHPGDSFSKTFVFDYYGSLVYEDLSIFQPKGQQLFADVSIALFPENEFKQASFTTHENVGYFFGEIPSFRKSFTWFTEPDQNAPFITLHEIINLKQIPAQFQDSFSSANLLAEIHFNEKVNIENLDVFLIDRNYEQKDITENPALIRHKLLPDQKTLLLGFSQNTFQQNERFYLCINGVKDLYKNAISIGNRTLITR